MKLSFPKIHLFLRQVDELRPHLHYAIIEQGKIIATDGNIMFFHDLSTFVINPENAEGKVLDCNTIKFLSSKKFEKIECSSEGFIAYTKKNIELKAYPGYFKIGKEVRKLYSNSGLEWGKYPDWSAVIPTEECYNKAEGLKTIGFNAENLSILLNCFSFEKNTKLKFQFWEQNKNVKITPVIQSEEGNQVAILCPATLKK